MRKDGKWTETGIKEPVADKQLLVVLLVCLRLVPSHHSLSNLLFESDSKCCSVWFHSVPGCSSGRRNTGHRDPAAGNTSQVLVGVLWGCVQFTSELEAGLAHEQEET